MAERTVDPNKAVVNRNTKEVKERVAGLVDLLQQEQPVKPVEKKPDQPVKLSSEEMSEAIINARQISLPVLGDITISIQTLGSDIYVVDGKVQPIPQSSLAQFFGNYVTKCLHPESKAGTNTSTRSDYCTRASCKQRTQTNHLGQEVTTSTYLRGGGPCSKKICHIAKPTPRT